METKSYIIGGKKFELRPLTWRQRKLAQPTEKAILGRIITLADAFKGSKKTPDTVTLRQVHEVSLQISDLLFAEDRSFLKFLATILTSPESGQWKESDIEANAPIMEEITDDVLSEVITDFFIRSKSAMPGTKIIHPAETTL